MIGITVGQGVKRPRGAFVMVKSEAGLVEAVASTLRTQPNIEERWWSPHRWADNYRDGAKWQSSIAVAVDVDWHDSKSFPSPQTAAGLAEYARTGAIPGSIFHSTPHGCRVIFVFDQPCTDRSAMFAASEGAAAIVQGAFVDLGLGELYKVDSKVVKDLARLFFVPTCRAKNVQRQAEVITMRPVTYSTSELAGAKPVRENGAWTDENAGRPREPTAYTDEAKRVSLIDAIKRWNADHPGDWPRHSAQCPVCKDSGSFGRFPDDPARWACFSTDHPSNVGVRGPTCMHGDALDLESFRRGARIGEVLRQDGYLARPSAKPAPAPTVVDKCGTAALMPAVAQLPAMPRVQYRPNSILTAYTIIESNDRDVLGGKLEFNEMLGEPTINRKRVTTADLTRVRVEIERRHSGGVDKHGNQVGLKLSQSDVDAAVYAVAESRPFHPVREYLDALKWDGLERICHVPELITCVASTLNLAILKRWFVSAVARAFQPGCQVDTVLVLQGDQGIKKSSFFSVLGDVWHADTKMNLESKDCYMALDGVWLYEWGELASAQKSSGATIRNFITSRVDTYRRPYDRVPSRVPRTSVIVATINPDEFLEDETGKERRYWPIHVDGIDRDALREQRDQLWAEAVHLYRAGDQWHLTKEEEDMLKTAHAAHAVADEWAPTVLGYAKDREDVTIGAVLGEAFKKPIGQWTKSDEMRIGEILTKAGWKKQKRHGGVRVWNLPEGEK
jgi:predicted P-loop ATPase